MVSQWGYLFPVRVLGIERNRNTLFFLKINTLKSFVLENNCTNVTAEMLFCSFNFYFEETEFLNQLINSAPNSTQT